MPYLDQVSIGEPLSTGGDPLAWQMGQVSIGEPLSIDEPLAWQMYGLGQNETWDKSRGEFRAKMTGGRKAPARKAFLRWMKRDNPRLYRRVIDTIDMNRRMMGRQITQFGDSSGMSGLWDDIVSTVKTVAPTLLQTKAQYDLYKLQLQRAKSGLPPLPASAIAPTINVQTELGPETRREMITAGGEGIKKLILPIGLGVGALALFMMMKK